MKLGTETGSLANWIMSGQKAIVPELETPATILSWTDRHPATVTRVWKQGKFHYVEVTMDEWERIDNNGFSEVQEYVYTRNPNGAKYYYKSDR